MNNWLRGTTISLSVVLLCAFVMWRNSVAAHAKPTRYSILADLTQSHAVDRPHACLAVAGILESIMDRSSNQIGTTVQIVGLGDSSRGGQPLLIAQQSAIPVRSRLSTGEDVLRRKQQEYAKHAFEQCVNAPSPEYSAIYLGIQTALAGLREEECGNHAQCVVFVDTDGEENVDPTIKRRLFGASSKYAGKVQIIDNTGIEVRFCGLSEARVRVETHSEEIGKLQAFHFRPSADHLSTVWRSVFARPNEVSFEPFCPLPARTTDYLQVTAASN